ncbi:HDOD domain-containing protein [Pseudomonas typographi]|uniref:HDOD domain-containing protein n=1 Tax=Pseudomonas typographi TaxID=2715964 RepID=A0ABR7Z633_9PSED|nr:HDOD domain-containing protein [Pseudomonas typographi]MBD1551811.1 HDOD domain-containing protein [Pseudomonas typographi]MBD1587612.1 HDOD domain-containing protein [Pseudomonas typographi]MBD1600798.1 HDOD domain-containing protein [Pseudomonas typographi]
MPVAIPNSVDTWVKALADVRLPVPTHSHDRVSAYLNDSSRSLREIAECMQQSPALVLNVIREANAHANSALIEPAESLEVAITRMGLQRTGELLKRLPAMPSAEIPQALRQLQLVSQHASQLANGLFAARLARLWQEVHWGALLFLAPLWPIALTQPGLIEDWELRVVRRGEPAVNVERALFGVPLLDICQALAERWRLPLWVLQGYRSLGAERRSLARVMLIARDFGDPLRQQQRLDAEPALRRFANQPAISILLANGLALAAQQGWATHHALRWEYLIALYTQMPLGDVQQQVHQESVHSARQVAQPDLWHPATALIWPWHERRPLQPAPPPSAEALVQWRRNCTDLLAEPSPFNNAMHLATTARDALVACGMQRVLLLMPDKSQTVLLVQQLAGLPKPAAQLSFALDQGAVLKRLAQEPGQIRVTPANSGQFSHLIPASLRVLFRGEHLLLRSLASHGRVAMLVVADQGGGPLSDITVQAFGKTAQCIEKALAAFSNRNK